MSEKPQTFDEWWTEQVMTGEDSIICRELTKLGVAELAYNAGQQSMATAPELLQEIVTAPKTCCTCRFWSFRSSADKSWGRCMNEKMHDSIHISIDCPNRMKTIEEYHQFMRDVRENCQVYFEEDSFGCIHYEKKNDMSK